MSFSITTTSMHKTNYLLIIVFIYKTQGNVHNWSLVNRIGSNLNKIFK